MVRIRGFFDLEIINERRVAAKLSFIEKGKQRV
jgi:hypothetical protein